MAIGVLITALRWWALVLLTRYVTPCRIESQNSSSEEYLGAEAIVPPEAMHYLAANSRAGQSKLFLSGVGTRLTKAA
jgi:hypothetical protein